MAGDFGSSGIDSWSAGATSQNAFGGGQLEPFQPQPLDASGEQTGGSLDGFGPGSEGLDPMQPMADFTAKWQDADGNWIGDPTQRYQEYVSALTESRDLSVNTMLGAFDQAAANPPWANPAGGSVFDGTTIPDRFATAEPVSEVRRGAWEEVTADGRSVTVSGLDPYWQAANLDSVQGDEVPGVQGDCGLVSVVNVARQFGIPVTEGQVVEFAAANGLCEIRSMNPTQNGGSTPFNQADLLRAMGIPAHVEHSSLGQLADDVDRGHSVIIGVNAGELWDDSNAYGEGLANHAVTVTGVVRDADGDVQGYLLCDSGHQDSRRFVSVTEMERCWEGRGCVVTDDQRTQGYPPGVSLA